MFSGDSVSNRSCPFSSPSTLIIHIGQWYNCSIVHSRSIQRFIPCTLGSHPAQLHFGVFSYIYSQSYPQYPFANLPNPNIWFAWLCIQLYSQVISQIIQVGRNPSSYSFTEKALMFSKGATWQFTMGDNVNDGGSDVASAGDGVQRSWEYARWWPGGNVVGRIGRKLWSPWHSA